MKTEGKIQFVWNGSDTFAMQIWICLSSYSISTGLSSTGEMRVEVLPQISRGLPNSGSGAFEIRWNVLAAQKFLLTEIVVGNPGRVSGGCCWAIALLTDHLSSAMVANSRYFSTT